MTDAQFKARMSELRKSWADDSNATEDQEELFTLCEQFIVDMDEAIELAGGHPDPPPPRVRH